MKALIGVFLFITVRLWPVYVVVAAVAFVLSIAGGTGAVDSLKTATTWAFCAVLLAPGGRIAYVEGGPAKLLLIWALWMALLSPLALALLEWSDQ